MHSIFHTPSFTLRSDANLLARLALRLSLLLRASAQY